MLERLIAYEGTKEDWTQFLGGETWEEYTRPIVDAYAELERDRGKGNFDRNDILRPVFNATCVDSSGNVAPSRLDDFYANPVGTYARVRVYERSEKSSFLGVMSGGDDRLTHRIEYASAHCIARQRFGDNYASLDHGGGDGYVAAGLAVRGSRAVVQDYAVPSLLMCNWLCKKNGLDIKIVDPREENAHQIHAPYHLVVTMDVLEHVADPVRELEKIHEAMSTGGILLMGTFFNSCDGKDPQHLEAHAKYQDVPVWFSEVERIGFRLVGRDLNGCEKLWEKT